MHEEGLDHHAHAQGRAASNRAPLIGCIPQAGVADNVCSEDRRQFALLTGHGKFPVLLQADVCRAVSRLPNLARTRCQLHGVRRETPTGRGGGGERQAAFYLAMSRPGPKTLLALDLEANENNPSNSMRLDQAEAFVRAVADVIPVGLAAGFAIQSAVRIGRSASANAQSCARRVLPLCGGSPSSCFGTAPTSRSRREIVATRGSTTRIVRLRPARMGT